MAKPARRSIGSQRNPASEEAILTAAQDLLAEKGPGGFTIEAVARRAHAGKPTIYRWWPSRAHLLLAVFERQREPERHKEAADLAQAIQDHLAHLMKRWRDTPAGPVFRSILAEAQTDETAAKAVAEYIAGRRGRHARWLGSHMDPADADVVSDLVSSYALQRLACGRLDAGDPDMQRVAAFVARCAKTGPAPSRPTKGQARKEGGPA